MFLREILLTIVLWMGAPTIGTAEPAPLPPFSCHGQTVQAGLLLCYAPAGATLIVSGPNGEARRLVPVNADGLATVGLLRTETLELTIAVKDQSLPVQQITLTRRDDPFRTIKGMDCDKVDARTPEQIEHAGQSWVKKQAAFKTFSSGPGASAGFIKPADGPMSSPYGPERKYIGIGKNGETCEKTSVHYGYDMAVPVGTLIRAPAGGTVTLGDSDLYYEGGTVFLDHGEGLVSVFMHMSQVDVTPGQVVEIGDRRGASGNTGRTTGPHLHWAVKWRNPGSAERGRDFYIDPALLLELDPFE
ncbi:MAG: M23 family metallopeptidase [Henriciella sp.]|nr:M23 family metallopeptidase [Henriciella sp.]